MTNKKPSSSFFHKQKPFYLSRKLISKTLRLDPKQQRPRNHKNTNDLTGIQ